MKYIGLRNPTYVRIFNVNTSHLPDLNSKVINYMLINEYHLLFYMLICRINTIVVTILLACVEIPV